MVKLEDGSMVFAGQLLNGEGQDDEGKSLKFKSKDDVAGSVPLYTAEAPMKDGSGRKKIYSFDLGTTQVRVSVSTVEPEEKEKSKKDKEDEEDEGPKAATEARVVKTPPQTTRTNTR